MSSRIKAVSGFVRSTFHLLIFTLLLLTSHARGEAGAGVLLSEIYGGGGNSGALYTHDFIELYNPTSGDIVMTHWSVQYQSGGGSGPFGAVAVFSGTIRSHGFFLIQANQGSGGSLALPVPDAVAGFPMAATSGKIALVSDTVPVAGPGDTLVVDFVGYGGANLFEGDGPAVGAGNTVSIERKASPGSDAGTMGPGGSEEFDGNARDSDDNADDFIPRSEPEPQNSSSGSEHPGGASSMKIGYGDRWNLVSIPLHVPDARVSVLFPGALSPFYAYDGGYSPETLAVPGRGYWIRLEAPDTIVFGGTPITTDTIGLDSGWNLVGSVSSQIAVSAIVEEPAGHIQSGFYRYDGDYTEVTTLDPGRGYWVRSAGGSIILIPLPGSELQEPLPRIGQSGADPGFRRNAPPPSPPVYLRESPAGDPPSLETASKYLQLRGIHPNPFNPSTTIEFDLPREGEVRVSVVDLTGRPVATLLDGVLEAGAHSVTWNVPSEARRVSSGIYLVIVEGTGGTVAEKVLLLK